MELLGYGLFFLFGISVGAFVVNLDCVRMLKDMEGR